jgi:hypothetical protein
VKHFPWTFVISNKVSLAHTIERVQRVLLDVYTRRPFCSTKFFDHRVILFIRRDKHCAIPEEFDKIQRFHAVFARERNGICLQMLEEEMDLQVQILEQILQLVGREMFDRQNRQSWESR